MKLRSFGWAVLPALVAVIVAGSAQTASAAGTLIHQYRLNEWTGFTDDLGGPSLVETSGGGLLGAGPADLGLSLPNAPTGLAAAPGCAAGTPGATTRLCQGYAFTSGQGLSLSNWAGAGDMYADDYSIVLDYMSLHNAGLRKVIDYENLGTLSTNNNGLYIGGDDSAGTRNVQFFRDDDDDPAGGEGTVGVLGTMGRSDTKRIVVSRDGDEGVVTVRLVNPVTNVQQFQFSFNDVDNDGVFSGPNAIINFFVDELWDEDGAGPLSPTAFQGHGFVDTIRIYGGALTLPQVLALGEVADPAPPSAVPEPGSLLLLGSGLAIVARGVRRRMPKKA